MHGDLHYSVGFVKCDMCAPTGKVAVLGYREGCGVHQMLALKVELIDAVVEINGMPASMILPQPLGEEEVLPSVDAFARRLHADGFDVIGPLPSLDDHCRFAMREYMVRYHQGRRRGPDSAFDHLFGPTDATSLSFWELHRN